jgi:hypothetical protein
MKTLALLAGLTIATVLTGMVVAARTASETSIALPDQEGTCAECTIPHPTNTSAIPQAPHEHDGACSGCATEGANDPTIVLKSANATPAPSTEKLADGSSNCIDCNAGQPEGPRVAIAPTQSPPVKVAERAAGCADCAMEESRRQVPSRQSGGLKQRRTQQTHSSVLMRNRHAAHRGQRQQSFSAGDCPFSAEIKRVFSLM